ncbi:cilia- and flagella-associated protein 157 isoform X2 [Xenopus laevis]|uniref:Cilia- and flagella-associated protein 157 n=1 Tax=Xenopus laevis TaxID=8355 RepID=A0A8J0V1C1_XENLA|nr:cilia- and flagella-associated protein 157 isoform X2 [Xenopus laevis]
MPPKKKGKRGASSKTKEKEAVKVVSEGISEQTKECYEVQIRDLEGRLERYQSKWDEICAKEHLKESQYEKLSNDKKEIVSFLKRTLNQRMDEIADLNDQLLGLQQAKDAEKDAYEAQLAQVRHELQDTKERLTSENMLLAGKLASLEEFRVQKEELMGKFATLEEKLKDQEQEHKETMYILEKKAVLDKDRLKKEMVQRVSTVAAEFRRESNNQMAETTKRAIRENVSISLQLSKMSDKSIELISENDLLKDRNSELTKQLEVLEENEKELVKNNLSNQKVIRMLTDKCQQQQETLDLLEHTQHALNELQSEQHNLKHESQQLKQKLLSFENELHKTTQDKEGLSRQLEEEKQRRLAVDMILSQAAASLKDMLLKHGEDETEMMQLERRNKMLQQLQLLLDSSATLGLGSSLHEFETKQGHSLKSPKANRQPVSPILKGPGVTAHYRIGDLGLVPRQDLSNAVLSKTGMLSKITKLGPLRGTSGMSKELLSWTQEEKQIKQPALPDISAGPPSKTLLMAK